MARKRLNKTLIAWISGGAIFVAVAVVAVATYNAARDDPNVLARKAQDADHRGEYERALRYYVRAFRASKDPHYLIEGAKEAYKLGEIGQALLLLKQAHAQAPDDPDVLEALLQRYWEFRQYGFVDWHEVMDFADALLKQRPDDVLALVCRALALDMLRAENPDYAKQFQQALEAARKVGGTDPRVAQLEAGWLLRHAQINAYTAARQANANREQLRRQLQQAYEQAADVLRKSVAEHPLATGARSLLARVLADAGKIEDAIAVIEEGLRQDPDSPALRYEHASHMLRLLTTQPDRFDDAERLKRAREALADAERAIELAPAYYEVYPVRGDLQRLVWQLDGTWDKQTTKCQQTILQSFVAALENTAGLRSARAVLGREKRARLIVFAFDMALRYYQSATDDSSRKTLLDFARKFLAEAQTQYRESFVVPLMEGQLALIDNDRIAATKAFEEALRRLGDAVSRFAIMAHERLSQLYLQQGELGTALTHTDEALNQYAVLRNKPPLWLLIQKANLLSATDRAAEALDLLDALRGQYPETPEFQAARARALTVLGRKEEALKVASQIEATDVRSLMSQARIYAAQKDYDAATRILERVLGQQPKNMEAIRLYAQVQMLAGRREALLDWLSERAQQAQAQDAMFARTLRAIAVMVAEKDPHKRDAELLKLVQQIEDPVVRLAELVNFYASRDQYDKANEYLAQLIEKTGETPELVRMRFQIALRKKDFQAAERDLPYLAEHDVDHAHGEVFRGQLAAERGDPAAAIEHFRAAERLLPEDSQLKILLAQALISLPDPQYDEAIDTLEQAIAADPRSFQALKLLYICYEQSGRRSEGIEYLEKAAALNPEDPFIKERTELLEEQRNPQEGIAKREQRRRENPGDVENLMRLAELYARVGKLDQARACVLDAIERQPASRRVAVFATRFFMRLKDRDAGERALRQHVAAVDKQGDKPVLRVTGRLLMARFYDTVGAPDAALKALEEARRLASQIGDVNDETRLRLKVTTDVELAEHYGRVGALEDMIRTYQHVLDLIGDRTDAFKPIVRQARLKQLRALLSLGRFDAFDQHMTAFLNESPDDLEALKLQAESLITRQRMEEAESVLTQVLEQQPDDPWALYARGRVYIELRRYPDARRDLARLKRVAPDAFNYMPRFDLARVYELTGQIPMAEAELRELVEHKPDNRRLALQLVGLLARTDQLEKAQEFVNTRIARKPDDPFWYIQLGRILMQRKEYSAAVLPLRKALDLGADHDPTVQADWMRAMIRAGRAAEAVQQFRRWPPDKLIPALRTFGAEALLRSGDAEQAREQMRQALAEAADRSTLSVHYVSRRAIEVLGAEDGIRLIREVLSQVKPDSEAGQRLRNTLARRLLEQGSPQARAEARTLIEGLLKELHTNARDYFEVALMHAHLLQLDGELEASRKAYETLLSRQPNMVQALNNLAYLLADKLNRPAEALPYAERARKLRPGNPDVLDTVGWVYFLAGRPGRAEAALLEAVRLGPDNFVAHYHLAQVLARSGRTARARTLLERARTLAREANDKPYLSKIEEALQQLP